MKRTMEGRLAAIAEKVRLKLRQSKPLGPGLLCLYTGECITRAAMRDPDTGKGAMILLRGGERKKPMDKRDALFIIPAADGSPEDIETLICRLYWAKHLGDTDEQVRLLAAIEDIKVEPIESE